ncbi:hypothetical protein AAEP93_003211 [Penicillium crustosum]
MSHRWTKIGVHVFKPSRGIAVRSPRLPGRKVEADSHQHRMIRPSGSGIRPPASARQPSKGIAVRSARLPGRKMEADSHQYRMIRPLGSGIRPPASARQTLEGHSATVRSIAWSYNGSRLASASHDKTVRIWDPATGRCTSTLEGHTDSVWSIAWSQDGSRIASGSFDNTVRIWDPATGQCTSTLEGHSKWVTSIAWSQDGGRIASGSWDKTVRIWDPATGQCESTLHIGLSPDVVRFDKVNPNHLHTSIGTLDIENIDTVTSTHCSAVPKQYGYGLNDDRSWITYNGVNLLWLPAEYRPSSSLSFAMWKTNVAIGCSSGRVFFLELKEQSPIPGL